MIVDDAYHFNFADLADWFPDVYDVRARTDFYGHRLILETPSDSLLETNRTDLWRETVSLYGADLRELLESGEIAEERAIHNLIVLFVCRLGWVDALDPYRLDPEPWRAGAWLLG